MSAAAELARYIEFDGKVADYFPKAEKAIETGRLMKALAYGLLILAAQQERKDASDEIELAELRDPEPES